MHVTYQGIRTFEADSQGFLIPLNSEVAVISEGKSVLLPPSSYARYCTATDYEWGISVADEYSVGLQPGQLLLAHSVLVHEFRFDLGLEAAEMLADELAVSYRDTVIRRLNRANAYNLDGQGTYIEWSMNGEYVRKFVRSLNGSMDEWVTGIKQEQG